MRWTHGVDACSGGLVESPAPLLIYDPLLVQLLLPLASAWCPRSRLGMRWMGCVIPHPPCPKGAGSNPHKSSSMSSRCPAAAVAPASHLPMEVCLAIINAEVSGKPSMWLPVGQLPGLCGTTPCATKLTLHEGVREGCLQVAGTSARAVLPEMLRPYLRIGCSKHQSVMGILMNLSTQSQPSWRCALHCLSV